MSAQVNDVTKVRTGTGVRRTVKIGMLAAIAVVLMIFEIPLPFAPPFYEIDFSEVPVLIGAFAMGPAAGAAIELVKILLNFVFTGTDTVGVGELANFVIGCSLCLPAAMIYKKNKSKKSAFIGLTVGTVLMVFVGCIINAYVMLPVYAKAFGLPLDSLIQMGTAVNPNITSLESFVMLAVAPFNLLKATLVSLIVLLIYKKISPIFKL